jgi:hypothetical protein
MMRKSATAFVGALVASLTPISALACSCARNPTAEGLLASHASIFTGTVRAVQTIAPGQSVTTFVVSEPFKGAQRGEIVNIYHRSGSSAACGVTFDYGGTYTLAASRQGPQLWTSQCSTWMFLPHVGISGELITGLRHLRRGR